MGEIGGSIGGLLGGLVTLKLVEPIFESVNELDFSTELNMKGGELL